MAMRKIILVEFAITVYVDGTINWDRFDGFLWQRIHQPDVKSLTKRRPRSAFPLATT